MLFELKDFIMHSGKQGKWKIECDALTDNDWDTLAYIVAEKYEFGYVVPVPTGGCRFAKALQKYIKPFYSNVLVVDDVLTTGGSIQEVMYSLSTIVKGGSDLKGIVVFARGECPNDVEAIFQIWEEK